MKFRYNLDRVGIGAMLFTVVFSPCCFPLFAFAASALGLGSFEIFGSWTMWILCSTVLISVLGLVVSYRKHKCMYPLLIAVPSASLIWYGIFMTTISPFMYIGMLGMLLATFVNYYRFRLHNGSFKEKDVIIKSILKCPKCGFAKEEDMPEDACAYFYECEKCKSRITPLIGDCCVYCSYGSVPCPPMQQEKSCC